MHPIFFQWRGIKVHSYPAMQYIGLNLGVLIGNIAARATGLDHFRVFVATILLLFPALAGARILHVVTNWKVYRENPAWIWDTRQGGAAQYGGILLAVPLSIPLLASLDIPFGAFWDVAGITIMVGMVFTRVGCLLNGCCAGKTSDSWIAMELPDKYGVWSRRYPTQLLEAMWAAVILATGVSIWSSLSFEGALFIFIAAGYAGGRLVMESMRDVGATRFTVHHAISLFIIAVSIIVLLTRGSN